MIEEITRAIHDPAIMIAASVIPIVWTGIRCFQFVRRTHRADLDRLEAQIEILHKKIEILHKKTDLQREWMEGMVDRAGIKFELKLLE